MAARGKQGSPAVSAAETAFEGGTERVSDTLGFVFPGTDPAIGLGIVGVVKGYVERPSKHKDQAPYSVCELSHAVIFEPGDGEQLPRLVQIGDAAVIVSAWIAGTLTPKRFAPGAIVKVVYAGMQGRAKELQVFTVARETMSRILSLAVLAEAGEYARAATGTTPDAGTDDLPF